tara:strand:- start:817 stop:1797 length:981 start_codon:yes stop_codon:yes gene_type:complete
MNRLLIENATTGKIEPTSALEVNTDVMEATLTAIKGTGSGSIDDIASRSQTISERVEFVNGRLSNIQDWVGTQGGDGSGTKAGVMLDNISSSNNTISERVEFVNSRLNNIQTAQTSTTLGTGQNTRIVGTSNHLGTGTLYYGAIDSGGRQFVSVDQGCEIDAKNDAGTGKDLRCDDNGRLYANLVANTDISNDTSSVRVLCDATGKLEVVSIPNIVLGTFTCTDGAGTGLDQYSYSSVMDTLYHKTIHFTLIGSAGSGHGGTVLHGSNDNSTYVPLQAFAIQTFSIGGSAQYHYVGSYTSGHRYYKIQNNGTSMASTTTRLFQAYS